MVDVVVGDVLVVGGTFGDNSVHDIRRQFLVCLYRNREIAVTAARFNIKTTYFIRDDGLLVVLGDNIFE